MIKTRTSQSGIMCCHRRMVGADFEAEPGRQIACNRNMCLPGFKTVKIFIKLAVSMNVQSNLWQQLLVGNTHWNRVVTISDHHREIHNNNIDINVLKVWKIFSWVWSRNCTWANKKKMIFNEYLNANQNWWPNVFTRLFTKDCMFITDKISVFLLKTS